MKFLLVSLFILAPITGILAFIKVVVSMNHRGIQKPPIFELIAVFFNYGGLLLIILSELADIWSALSTLGALYIVFVAPIVMLVIIYRLQKTKKNSNYHLSIFIASSLYFIIMPATFYLLLS